MVARPPLGDAPVHPGTLPRVGTPLEDQAERDQVEGDGLDRSPLRHAGMLDGVGVDGQLADAKYAGSLYSRASTSPYSAQHAGEEPR